MQNYTIYKFVAEMTLTVLNEADLLLLIVKSKPNK